MWTWYYHQYSSFHKFILSNKQLICATKRTITSQSYAAGRANNTELLMLLSNLKVNAWLKILRGILWNSWNVLTRMCKRKKDAFWVGITKCQLLNLTNKPYWFNGDLIETSNYCILMWKGCASVGVFASSIVAYNKILLVVITVFLMLFIGT